MSYTKEEQPVGVHEIALLLGVEPATVSSWRQRKRLPNPEGYLNKGRTPFWKQGEILDWAAATGRNKNVDITAVGTQVYDTQLTNKDELVDTVVEDLSWEAPPEEHFDGFSQDNPF